VFRNVPRRDCHPRHPRAIRLAPAPPRLLGAHWVGVDSAHGRPRHPAYLAGLQEGHLAPAEGHRAANRKGGPVAARILNALGATTRLLERGSYGDASHRRAFRAYVVSCVVLLDSPVPVSVVEQADLAIPRLRQCSGMSPDGICHSRHRRTTHLAPAPLRLLGAHRVGVDSAHGRPRHPAYLAGLREGHLARAEVRRAANRKGGPVAVRILNALRATTRLLERGS
jgi:hypothetical protein